MVWVPRHISYKTEEMQERINVPQVVNDLVIPMIEPKSKTFSHNIM